jgi:hypothetical protein
MIRSLTVMGLLALAACGAPAQLNPSQRNQVAIVENQHEDRLSLGIAVRLARGQVLVPVRADAREEFCTFGRVIFVSSSPQGRSCFYDPRNQGRFTEAAQSFTTRAGTVTVNVPYRIEEFPCENCAPPPEWDVRPITDNQQLAGYSIAPRQYQAFVAMALDRNPGLDAAIAGAHPSDAQNVRRIVGIAAAEIVQRQAIARCTDLFSPVAAALVPFGAWAAMAAMSEEQSCVENWIRTGRMPPWPRPADAEIVTPR